MQPTIQEFLTYASEKIKNKGDNPKIYTDWLTDKFEAWKLNGWKKEKGAKLIPIKNWKSTLLQCLAYRQPNKVKDQPVRAEIITHRTTNKLEQMSIEELENAYNGEREGKYVHIKYFDVFDFLRSKGFIPKKNFTKEELEYFKKTKYNAQGMVYGRYLDRLKNCKPEHEKELREALNKIKAGKHHEIEPQAKVLVLTDLFRKYSLEQIKAKIK